MKKIVLIQALFFLYFHLNAQEKTHQGKFEQLNEEFATPNYFRTGSGAPGQGYWQQKVDYTIDVELDDEIQRISGHEVITYHNLSPDPLAYLWLQLDQNIRSKDSDRYSTSPSKIEERMDFGSLTNILGHEYDLGHKIISVKDERGESLPYTVNKTMMRVDLPGILESGGNFVFSVDWFYNINDRKEVGGRSGKEFFEEDGNYLYTIAQWFPRLAVYDDVNGWQHKQFLGRGEFTLPFGDYKVSITVPSDHIVASTGVLQNPEDVLDGKHLELFKKAENAESPVIIVTQKEAEKKEKIHLKTKKTWIYHAENVRDFAWASSRKFIWDAMGIDINGRKVMAMSYYPKEANPLYEMYSTKVVAHTLRVYSKHTIDYPYPVAISVEASNGMEYPMISFNYGRPEKDGTYSESLKYGVISVIIHEVGHNFFPMIINSDERQWTWMDEGMNSFLQFLAEQEWDRNYPSKRGPARKIIPYMREDRENLTPIMTNSEQIKQFSPNAYDKPATALNILRETIMGRELFDFAFKEYCRRWAFKHPQPEDFFRTMEDASAIDLDWFWKGWFYTVDHVDISIEDIKWYKLDTKDPRIENSRKEKEALADNRHISQQQNKDMLTMIEIHPDLKDFYNDYNEFETTDEQIREYNAFIASLSNKELDLLNSNLNFYEFTFQNIGGLVMPLIIQLNYTDGTSEIIRIPAEIWRQNEFEVTKVFAREKELESAQLDPFLETADVDENNNYFPRKYTPARFELYKSKPEQIPNPMQREK